MSTVSTANTSVSASNLSVGRGRGGKARGRGKGRGGHQSGNRLEPQEGPKVAEEKEATENKEEQSVEGDPTVSDDVCWICAEPVKYYSLSACNHRTCHVCALRLRALYKKDVCTFCKEPQPEVIFTTSPDQAYSDYNTLSPSEFYDAKLRINFETQAMMTDSLLLLRFNCPDSDCDYIAKGWGDLKMHVRASHGGKMMCDLCIRQKKVFAHEHVLYTYQQLRVHLPSMDYTHGRPQRKKPSATVALPSTGVHPLCEFCRECYFSEDELYAHMRERHEECFVCKRDGVRDVYFPSYPALETHFTTAHYACSHEECLQRKFVVFGSELDLQAHMVEEHGASRRVVGLEFQERERERGSGGARGRPQRDPPPRQQALPLPPPAPPGGQGSRRRQAFGGALTTGNENDPVGVSNRSSPNPEREEEVDPAVADRHAAFLALLSTLAPNPASALPAVKAAARGYRAGESSARDLIGIVWSVLDKDKTSDSSATPSKGKDVLEPTARVINSFVDLLEEDEEQEGVDEKDKKSLELLREWKGFEVEQRRQFPDLVALAASSSSGPYAAITSGRVLNAKHSTHPTGRHATSQAFRTGAGSSRMVWDRVAQAANVGLSSNGPTLPPPPGSLAAVNAKAKASANAADKFPPLGAGGGGGVKSAVGRKTPWANNNSNNNSSSSSAASSPAPTPAPAIRPFSVSTSTSSFRTSKSSAPPPKLSSTAFPGLPTSTNKREKVQVKGNVSLRNILGSTDKPPASKWGAGSAINTTEGNTSGGGDGERDGDGDGNGQENGPSEDIVDTGGGNSGAGKKGKGKGKQRQMLFTLGSFPS